MLLALVAAGMCAREVRGSDASTSTGSAVVELTPAELHKLEQGTWLLEFYAPWCGYCKQLEPIFEDVAAGLAGRGVEVARIDASKYKSAALRFGVQGFPTIMHVHDGDVRTYQGPRTEASMIEFATASWKSASIDLNSPLGGSPFSTGAKAVGVMVDNILTLQVETALLCAYAYMCLSLRSRVLTAKYEKCAGRVRLGARENQPITPRVAGTVGRVGHCCWQCMGPAVVAVFSCPPLHRHRLPKTGLAMRAGSCCQNVVRYRHDCASGEGGGTGRVEGRRDSVRGGACCLVQGLYLKDRQQRRVE